jgi:hypothetical protein
VKVKEMSEEQEPKKEEEIEPKEPPQDSELEVLSFLVRFVRQKKIKSQIEFYPGPQSDSDFVGLVVESISAQDFIVMLTTVDKMGWGLSRLAGWGGNRFLIEFARLPKRASP